MIPWVMILCFNPMVNRFACHDSHQIIHNRAIFIGKAHYDLFHYLDTTEIHFSQASQFREGYLRPGPSTVRFGLLWASFGV